MRTEPFLLLILMMMFLGCDSDKEQKLDFNKATVWVGKTRNVEIYRSGSYKIEVSNPDIVDTKIDGNIITIIGLQEGLTDIIIKEGDHLVAVLPVISYDLHGQWSDLGNSMGLHNEVLIEADNQNIVTSIRNELLESALTKKGISYKLEENNILKVYYENIYGISYVGSYEWQDYYLTLTYDNKSEKYFVEPIGNTLCSISIIQDYSEEYMKKYPDAGIKKVQLKRYLYQDNYYLLK